MKNITISVTESVEKFAKNEAVKQEKSLSRFVSDLLTATVNRRKSAEDWIRNFESEEAYVSTKGYKFNREELYDRKILR